MEVEILIRDKREEDEPFIYNTWLKSFKTSKYSGPIPNHLYWPFYSEVLKYLIDRCKILVACNPDIEKQVFGYIVYEESELKPIVHWTYVKRDFRKFGIGSKLLNSAVKDAEFFYTFNTRDSQWFYKNGIYWLTPIRKKELITNVRGMGFSGTEL